MKPINEMSLKEATARLKGYSKEYENCVLAPETEPVEEIDELADRIHKLTRWISVDERMPTIEDADENGEIYIWSVDGSAYIILLVHALDEQDDYHIGFTHWKRIDKPEGV